MKITKTRIVEDIDSINPDESIKDIADDVVDQVEASGEQISDTNATKLAQEIAETGEDTGAGEAIVIADEEALGTDNEITKVLEKALQRSKRNARRNIKSGNNILIVGLPGSGKTASVYDWAKSKNGDVNLVYINAKNNDLEAYINGYTVRDAENPMKVGQAYSDNLAELEKPNSVLFLDEYNRQVKPHIRASLYTLINEHKIAGTGENKTHEFKNLLFTVACINPAVPTDKGAAPLNDAEISRFAYVLNNADSSASSVVDYLRKLYDKKIKKLDPTDSYYLEDLKAFLYIQDLGTFIVSHRDFEFNTKDDLEDLAMNQKKMLNQRSFTEGLTLSDGDVLEFKEWLNNESNFMDKDIAMINSILNEYIAPNFEDLCAAKGIDLTAGTINMPADSDTNDEANNVEANADNDTDLGEIEDDDDFFTNATTSNSTQRVKNPQEVIDAIRAAAKNW